MADTSKPTVVVSETLSERALGWLAERANIIRCDAEDAINHVEQADGLIVRTYTQVNPELLDRAIKLKVVGRAGVALENVDIPAARARGVEVVHTPASNTLAVVDYVMGALVRMNRKFWPMSGPVTPEEFHKSRKGAYGSFLSSKTIGIIGCGRIGSRVGRAAAALGMKVLWNDIRPIELDYPATEVDKETLYHESDIITIHVTLNESTTKFMAAEQFAQFKEGCQFINAARGQCVDYDALANAIRNGQVAAATIDVHDPEPPPMDYPMFGLDNVFLSPHTAARVPEAMERMCDVVYDIMAVINGESPEYPAPRD